MRKITKSVLALLLISHFASIPSHAEVTGPYPTQSDLILLNAMYVAGKQRDSSKVPQMIALIKSTTYPLVLITVLHSLAQMGVTDALPNIDSVIQDRRDQKISNFAIVEKYRLIAESTGNQEPDTKDRARAKLVKFISLMPWTSAQINDVVKQYEASVIAWSHPVIPAEVYAMRETADIIYQGQISNYATLPGAGQMDFSLDYPSWLKAQLATRSETDQIVWLIQDLSQKKALTMAKEDYEIQLAKEKGNSVGAVAVSKLKEMEQQRNVTPLDSAGFSAVLSILVEADDPQSAPLLEHFKTDADTRVRELAQQGGAGHRLYDY